jgi:hypothetical protein
VPKSVHCVCALQILWWLSSWGTAIKVLLIYRIPEPSAHGDLCTNPTKLSRGQSKEVTHSPLSQPIPTPLESEFMQVQISSPLYMLNMLLPSLIFQDSSANSLALFCFSFTNIDSSFSLLTHLKLSRESPS